ncbi:DUF493 domain-containing protein [Flavicella marina]|uniref:DUF493 domain-containing protein n=1 Tax=Flavicella marina TaxID=1475951 RepID=UPI001264FAEC|nr:DUF493 domain-containing protein [Flavicella marina]
MSKQSEFYDKLKKSLDETTTFPSTYLYKFIVPTSKNQLQEVKTIFDISGAVINTKASKTNKYVSVSIRVQVKSSEEVIAKYQEVSSIEGIISL